MMIRSIRKSDYWGVDRLLLQLHQMDVSNRPDMFAPITRYMTRDSFNSLVENPNVIALLAREKGTAVGCCFVSMLQRSGMTPMKSAYIDLLVVDEKHRHRGIGRALFQEDIWLEPSALAGMYGPVLMRADGALGGYPQAAGISPESMERSTQLVWATGGSMVPKEEMRRYYEEGKKA